MPYIVVISRATDVCSEARILTCNVTTVNNVFAPPTVTWYLNGNPVAENGNPRMNPATGQLIFSDISSGNTGTYTCRASLNIPEAGIYDHYREITSEVTLESKS